jgi:capsular exopolysaccharide synthesis family protein
MDVSFRSLPETEQNLIRIERQFTLSENLYTYLQEKRAEAAITKASNTVNNKIIEPATGGFKITPKPLQNYTVAFLIGILFPLILIFLKEIFRTKIEDLKFLERRLRIPILSTILLNRTDNNLVVLNQGKSGISEGFRSLRANLKYVLQRDDKITIMVTSTISGEGKTFCAVNLASVYSLTGKKTVLLGCDMRKPKIFGDFQIENKKGLSTFLSGESNDWKEVISPSGYENLDILVAGPTPPNPAELLLSVRFTALVEELKKEYDVIIMDTPPVGLVSETLDLLNHVDLTLFVFRQNYSQRTFIDSLNTLKGTKNLKSIYAVFNGVDMTKVNSGYGYSYGYGYGYYEDYK